MKAPITKPGEMSPDSKAIKDKPVPSSKETTRGAKPKKEDHIFSQSRDVREDRGTRQIKNTIRNQSSARGR
jgi:hypothetical protein